MLFGTFAGCLLGYFGGIVDVVFRRLVDVIITLPFVVLVIAIVAVLGPGLTNMYIAISAVGWIVYARLVRAEVLTQRRLDYVASGRVMGYGARASSSATCCRTSPDRGGLLDEPTWRWHILLGSSLGYLGLGAQPPTAEWGVLIADGKNFLTTAWWMSIFPGVAIVLAGIGFSLAGDGLAERLRRRSDGPGARRIRSGHATAFARAAHHRVRPGAPGRRHRGHRRRR